MLVYESIEKFVNDCLDSSKKYPQYAKTYESQAFGAIRYFNENCYKTQPELETKLCKMWEETWRPMFEDIIFRG